MYKYIARFANKEKQPEMQNEHKKLALVPPRKCLTYKIVRITDEERMVYRFEDNF